MSASERTDPGTATTQGENQSRDGSGQTPAGDVRSLATMGSRSRYLRLLRLSCHACAERESS